MNEECGQREWKERVEERVEGEDVHSYVSTRTPTQPPQPTQPTKAEEVYIPIDTSKQRIY